VLKSPSRGDPRRRDPAAVIGTIRSIITKGGGDESGIRVRARGPELAGLPLPFPLRVQLHVGLACFEASFSAAERNDARRARPRPD
jgi:hypothetical protein